MNRLGIAGRLAVHTCLALLTGLAIACNPQPERGVPAEAEREIIHTENAPEPVGPYSQAVREGNTLYLSGQVGLVPGTGELAEGGIEPQTRQVMQNLAEVLEEAGFTYGDIVDVQVYLADIDHYAQFNKIYASRFGDDPPARAVVEVENLPLGALVEIKMTAVRSK